MRSFVLITALLLAASANVVFGDELVSAGQNDLAEIMRQQSEVISRKTQERALGIAIAAPVANEQRAEKEEMVIATVAEPRVLSRALLLAALETPLLQ